jgi:4-aminobutyrate aminotransferase/4-aminobutyrate aminotransferase/(S)-3-amino-2-methylpropionate transaminase
MLMHDYPQMTDEFPGPESLRLHNEELPLYTRGHPAQETYLPLAFVSGHRTYLIDADGKKYIDFCAGLAVPCGHRFPPVVKAVQKACDQLDACDEYTHPYRAKLLKVLADTFPGQLGHVQFYSSGTEAVEAGLRFVRAVSGKDEFLAFHGSYHGKTLGSKSLASMKLHDGFRATGFYRAPYANCYRCAYRLRYPECELHCVSHLKEIIEQQGTGRLAGIVVEPIQGAAGVIVPPRPYLQKLQELCREFGALLMLDEILTGLGRTGMMFAFQHYQVTPDVVAIGKGLGNGMPITAVLLDIRHRDQTRHVGGGTTYGGNPISCAAAVQTLTSMSDAQLTMRAKTIGNIMMQRLRRIMSRSKSVGDVRGLGCLAAVEFVRDKVTKEPAVSVASKVYREACRRGLLTAPIGNVLRLTPPLVVTERTVNQAMNILEKAILQIEQGS